jgi:hypothetical protein
MLLSSTQEGVKNTSCVEDSNARRNEMEMENVWEYLNGSWLIKMTMS